MKQIDILKNIKNEFYDRKGDISFNFMTSRNGQQVSFSSILEKLIDVFSNQVYLNDKTLHNIKNDIFLTIVKQCIIDFLTENEFDKFDDNDKEILQKLKSYIKQEAQKEIKKFTHYIPVATLGFEQIKTYNFSDIKIISTIDLIDEMDSITIKKFDYKTYFKKIINKEKIIDLPPKERFELDSLIDALEISKSYIEVTIFNLDSDFSFKLSNIIAKTLLDSISLILGNKDFFHQQMLISDRSVPIKNYKILKINGDLMLPRISLTGRIPLFSAKKISDILDKEDYKIYKNAISKILDNIKDSNAKYYQISNRWATALDWYAEGIREMNDSTSLVKLASALDVLSDGAKCKGILDMLLKLFRKAEDDFVAKDITVKNFVEKIYDKRRSKIIHGKEVDRLRFFETERKNAIIIIREVLMGFLLHIYKYNDDDFNGSLIKIIGEE